MLTALYSSLLSILPSPLASKIFKKTGSKETKGCPTAGMGVDVGFEEVEELELEEDELDEELEELLDELLAELAVLVVAK